MILYLYALADALDDVSDLTGIEHEPLVLVSLPEAVVVGGWIEHSPALRRETLIAQDHVVRELHARAAALLPMRFGACMADIDAVAAAVTAFGDRLRERFALVRGREQMTVRVLAAEGAEGAGRLPAEARHSSDRAEVSAGEADGVPCRSSTRDRGRAEEDAQGVGITGGVGTRYLFERAAKATPPELQPLIDALRPLQRATRIEAGRRPEVIGAVYHLIDRDAVEEYRQTTERIARQSPSLKVLVTGPAPPYAFASLAS